jgi:hypothetical protein
VVRPVVTTARSCRSLGARVSRFLLARAIRVCRAHAKAHGRLPRLLTPRRFTDKMQWRKLFDFNPAFPTLCDKLAVRDLIAERVGCEYLVPLLWSGVPAEIPFDRVAPPFVLKSSHASGQVIMVGRDEMLDAAAVRMRAEGWLSKNYGVARDEPGYEAVPPCLMIEQMLTTEAGARPHELRLFVFDGKVAVINSVFVEDGRLRNGAFHTTEWTRLNWHFTRAITDRDFPKPTRLAEMIGVAERLGEGLDHLRVDVYDCGDRIWIGELTVYSWSGHARFEPDEADFELGSYWRQPAATWRTLISAAVRGRRFPASRIRSRMA